MSNIITARDPGIIAAEINIIKRQVQEAVIYGIIKIGEKLCEAKSLVSQGEWGKWLEENVEYSQSTAENMMKLYREYGGNQQSLFDAQRKFRKMARLVEAGKLPPEKLQASYGAWKNHISHGNCRGLAASMEQKMEEVLNGKT